MRRALARIRGVAALYAREHDLRGAPRGPAYAAHDRQTLLDYAGSLEQALRSLLGAELAQQVISKAKADLGIAP